jgi:tRNA(fMet)-specific endonuclease VapC
LLIDFFIVLPLPVSAGDFYGSVCAELQGKGRSIANNDLWIAAPRMATGLTVVTNNQKELRRVRGLKIENWTS